MVTERIQGVGLPEVTVTEEPRKFDPPSSHRFALKSANKRLALFVDLIGMDFYVSTAISTDKTAIKMPGATSAVYQKAADILEEMVQQHEKPIRYILATRNDVMKLWTRDQV